MPSLKPLQLLEKDRLSVAEKVRELRVARNLKQSELARHLGLSQSRLSELERGAGSFTAEQLLAMLRLFNASASDFSSQPAASRDATLQNTLARLGAEHLRESGEVLPSAQLSELNAAIREALVERGSPRLITALAPVLVHNVHVLNLRKLLLELASAGLDLRFGWVVDNTLAAIEALLPRTSGAWARKLRQASAVLAVVPSALASQIPTKIHAEDVFDSNIGSTARLQEVLEARSSLAKRWGIVSGLQPEDFADALRAAHENT